LHGEEEWTLGSADVLFKTLASGDSVCVLYLKEFAEPEIEKRNKHSFEQPKVW